MFTIFGDKPGFAAMMGKPMSMRPNLLRALFALPAAALLMPGPAMAALPEAGVSILADSGDTAWLLGGTMLALLAAIPGLLLYVLGHVGRHQAQRVLTAAIAGMMLATLLFFAVGYSLMFDQLTDNAMSGWLGGGANIMLNAMGTIREGTTIPETGFVVLRLSYILLSVTLLTAVLAPRARPGWLVGFSALWVLLVLVPVNRWLSDSGWLTATGALDYVGGISIFYCTGASALIASVLIGGKATSEAEPTPLMQLSGASLLLVGMAALAAASTGGASDDAAVAVINMLTASATAALMLCALRRRLEADALAAGLVAGIVAMAAGGDGVSVGGAWLIGIAAALASHFGPSFMPKRFTWQEGNQTLIGISGAAKTGAFLFAIFLAFMPFGGSGYPEGMTMGSQIIAQLIAILAVAGWSVLGTLIAALSVSLLLPMRDAKAAD